MAVGREGSCCDSTSVAPLLNVDGEAAEGPINQTQQKEIASEVEPPFLAALSVRVVCIYR